MECDIIPVPYALSNTFLYSWTSLKRLKIEQYGADNWEIRKLKRRHWLDPPGRSVWGLFLLKNIATGCHQLEHLDLRNTAPIPASSPLDLGRDFRFGRSLRSLLFDFAEQPFNLMWLAGCLKLESVVILGRLYTLADAMSFLKTVHSVKVSVRVYDIRAWISDISSREAGSKLRLVEFLIKGSAGMIHYDLEDFGMRESHRVEGNRVAKMRFCYVEKGIWNSSKGLGKWTVDA